MKRTETPPSPSTRKRTLLLLAAAALILALMVARHCVGLDVPSVDPIISLERSQSDDSSSSRTAVAPSNLPPNFLDSGEVYRTADRLREASALALAAALYAVNEQANRRYFHTADSIIVGMRSTGLLPPGITVEAAAMLLSPFGRLLLRFRPNPLAVEVVDIPHSREDGPALIVRIPGLDFDGERGSVFIADRLGDVNPPAPFASISDCVRAGWIDHPINQADTPQKQQQQLRAWLATRLRR